MAIKTVPARPTTGSNIATEYGQWVHDLLNNQFDVSASAGRIDFIGKAINNENYILYHNNDVYDVWTTNVQTGTQINFTGWRLWDDGSGTKAREFVFGIVTENAIQPTGATIIAGKYKALEAKLPAAVEPLELTSKVTTEQMLIDAKTSNDFDEAYPLLANQVEKVLANANKEMIWRHGLKLKSTVVSIGHPINEGMSVSHFDDYNNWITIVYNVALEQQVILKYPERVVQADVNVSKITDWDDAWNGAGVATGTNDGWKVVFDNPINPADGTATTFPHASTPIEIKLVAVDQNGTTVNVDIPRDFIINPDNDLGKSSKNKEMSMQFNIADGLGNTWLSYNRNSEQIINLPENKTIYDIEKISGYTNNKYKWYVDYQGSYLPKRLGYLTLENYNLFGDDCKIIVENHRDDDHNNLTFTEYLVLELRPVIENGVMNLKKFKLKNKGIYTGGGDNILKVLVDNVQDTGTETAQAAHIHYINIWFRGGA